MNGCTKIHLSCFTISILFEKGSFKEIGRDAAEHTAV
jgi:hypothetical protein